MVATKLSSALVAPSKVANLLDWRKAVGSVMALNITHKAIGMAVATHPDQHAEAIALRPLSLVQQQPQHHHGEGAPSISSSFYKGSKKNHVSKELISELEAVVRRHRVCAFVVNWPTHEGRMGEQCGKVLHVLDTVIDQSNSVVTRKRPFTLWSSTPTATSHKLNHCFNDDEHASSSLSLSSSLDVAHSSSNSPPDEWGRSIHFAKAPAYYPDMYYSSKNPIQRQETLLLSSSSSSSTTSSDAAVHVLNEWMKNHWELDTKMGCVMPVTTKSIPHFCTHSVDEYNSDKACLQSALL